MKLQRTLMISILLIIPILCFGSTGKNEIKKNKKTLKMEELIAFEKSLGDENMKFIKPNVINNRVLKRANTFGVGMVETGIDNKLLVLNNKGEFCYLDLTNPNKPRLEVITPNFPGVGGTLGSDAENRVAWLARGRGLYMIDLDTKKTGHMIAGNYGQMDRVLMTDKERLLFMIITFSGEANIIYAYELGTGTDYGLLTASGVGSFYTLGNDTIIWEQTYPTDPALSGWYLTDSLFKEIKEKKAIDNSVGLYPGEVPLTKALTEKGVDGVADMSRKHLHEGKRILYGRIPIEGTHKNQPVMVKWNEDLGEVEIEPLLLQQPNARGVYYEGPSHMSGDGNWMTGIRSSVYREELVVYHLQENYPQGMSMPISLGYTDKSAGAFLNHTTLGPLYVEKPFTDALYIYEINDGLEILREEEILRKTAKPRTLNDVLREYKVGKEAVLHVAVEEGDTESVQILINAGVLVNIQDDNGKTALYIASYFGYTDIVEILISANADVNIKNTHGETALIHSSGDGDTEIVRALIKAGADVNIQSSGGSTALISALNSNNANRTEIAKILIEAGADVNIKNNNGYTAFYHASNIEIVKLLIDLGADVNVVDDRNRTVLYWAADGGNSEMVKFLLENGAALEVKEDNWGHTALMAASTKGHTEVVKLLISAGADINVKNNQGRTALINASRRGYREIMKLLIENGADIDATETDSQGNYTVLMYASRLGRGDTEIVKLLLDRGVDVNAKNKYGETALMSASENGLTEIVKLLISGGTDISDRALFLPSENGHTDIVKLLIEKGVDVNVINSKGETALMWAINRGRAEIVSVLISGGADVNIQDNEGVTALMSASKNSLTEIVKSLISGGADVNIKNNEGKTALMLISKKGYISKWYTEVATLLKEAGATE